MFLYTDCIVERTTYYLQRKPRRFSVDEDLLTLSGDLSVYGVTAVYHWALDSAEMKDETTAIALSTSTGTQVVWPHQVPFCYAEQVRQFCLDQFGLDYTLPHARNPDVYADYESDDDDDETGPPADSDGNFEVDSIDCILLGTARTLSCFSCPGRDICVRLGSLTSSF